ncbi:protein of unknown function [Methylocella tundrae]|uniref:Transposase IS30-like HTH domain-containing protein n=1 Tax=Methylocella tundrae TaxID=227605 RepID=A0A4U8Z383_METTU|nr:protein of unknown function [Methylocella tundrae]
MNKLAAEDRTRILHFLCEGQSIRAVTRLTGASKNTVTKRSKQFQTDPLPRGRSLLHPLRRTHRWE